MSPLGPTSALGSAALRPALEPTSLRDAPVSRAPAPPAPAGGGFGEVLENLVSGVENRQADARAVTRSVLLGENPNLHQGVIAMQEASVAFSLMVEVRNKVVESYQELMRMPV
jgi:flagellar hook-basal body complex protein FliE